MRVLLVHPSALMYSELYLRLEPLGMERVAAAVRAAGHDVRLVDLQVFTQAELRRELDTFKPRAVGFSVNYLANVPEVLDLAQEIKRLLPECFVFVGGHSASFIAPEFLDHARGAIDCVVRGEGEVIVPRVLDAVGERGLESLPGVLTPHGAGPRPTLRTSRRFASRTSSWWTTWPSSMPRTASPSARRSSAAGSGRSTTSRPAATCSSRTARSSPTGSGSACTTCSSASRRSTKRRSR